MKIDEDAELKARLRAAMAGLQQLRMAARPAVPKLKPDFLSPPKLPDYAALELRVLEHVQSQSRLNRQPPKPKPKQAPDKKAVEQVERIMAERWRARVEEFKPRVYAVTPDWRAPREDEDALFGLRLFEEPKARYWAFSSMAKRRAFMVKHPQAQRCPNPLPPEPFA